MSESVDVRIQPHLNIGAIGHAGHGKTTLTAAIATVLGGPAAGAPRDDGSPVASVGYATGTRRYTHLDLPGQPGHITHMVSGAARLDGAILVVSAPDGVMPQTAEHLLLARQVGVDHVVVALAKADASDDDRTDRVEREVRDLLTAYGYGGETAPVVRVSALRALAGEPRWRGAVEALLDAVDTYVPLPVRSTDAPFLLPVESARSGTDGESVVSGAVERGVVRVGDQVELIGAEGGGAGNTGNTGNAGSTGNEAVVTGVETFDGPAESAGAGESVSLRVRGVPGGSLQRGDVVAAPGSLTPRRRFTARVSVLGDAGASPLTGTTPGARFRFHLRTADVAGTARPAGPDGARPERVRPGETPTLTVAVELDRGLPLEPGLGFAVRADGRTVGAGTVTEVV
ncbi:GTP-binding protein [Streptomyces sp. NPDC057638]|uniref:GTP-binding protein n=1 Tax=Streptomyces sp. NPDC057638 TaxID=3346190 RepID=UPI00367DC364